MQRTARFCVVAALCLIALVAPVQAQGPSVTDEYLAAKRLFDGGDVAAARAGWQSILANRSTELTPQQQTALHQCLARCDAVAPPPPAPPTPEPPTAPDANLQAAAACCNAVTGKLQSELPSDVVERERALLQALEHLKATSTEERRDERFGRLLAFAHLHLGKVDQACTFAEKALEHHADSVPLLVLRAEATFAAKRYGDCVAAADSVLAKNPMHSDANYWRVRALLARNADGDVDAAWKLCKRAVGNDHTRADELATMFPDPRMRQFLEQVSRDIRNEAAREEIARDRAQGTQVISAGGTGAGGVTRVGNSPGATGGSRSFMRSG